jgi:predicted metal-dependent HD superfamily phosphohydrolase
MVSPERLSSMRNGWMRLFARNVPGAPELFERLVESYSTPNRAYHNLEHLAEMFDVIKRLAPVIADPDSVHFAVWFHDAVYDTCATDNEERSAQLAKELLTPLAVPRQTIARVAGLVRATAHLASTESPFDTDTAALLDADLAILGTTPERYSRYARDIRLEYHWVPEADYRRGRAAVLQAFLARPRIFHHTLTFEVGEERARSNLKVELDSLKLVSNQKG